jgi:MinD superfamily P-loop ATPase
MVCPADAIGETQREVGTVERGRANGVAFAHGSLRVGEAMSPPLIRAVKRADGDEALTIIDAPPGTSCPVIEAVRHVDAVLLVTEPTPFGLNDLKLAVDMVRALDLPFAVAINRADVGDDGVERFCRDEDIAVLARIPDDRRIAECYSRGGIVVTDLPEMRPVFEEILEGIKRITT